LKDVMSLEEGSGKTADWNLCKNARLKVDKICRNEWLKRNHQPVEKASSAAPEKAKDKLLTAAKDKLSKAEAELDKSKADKTEADKTKISSTKDPAV